MSALLELEKISVTLHTTQALRGVSLNVQRGEIIALLGPNGAGKTTLMRASLGLVPAEGVRALSGADPAKMTNRERALRVAYLPQRPQSIWPISVAALVALGRFAHVYARFVTGLPVSDSTSGFKGFRRQALQAVNLDRVESEGYAFQIEVSFRAWRKGFTIGEIPIVFADRTLGESKMSKKIIWEAVWKVWKLRLLDLFGKL